MNELRHEELERLYVRLEKPLYNVVYRWLWQRDEAREVVQEAFARLWRMRGRVDMTRVEPLVYRIALNLAANRRRTRKLWQWVGLQDQRLAHATTSEHDLMEVERAQQVRDAIEALPEELRRVIVMCELSELPYAEVAMALEIPVGTVGSRRNRALKLLERALGPTTEDDDAA